MKKMLCAALAALCTCALISACTPADDTEESTSVDHCIIPVEESCYVPLEFDSGTQLVQGRYRDRRVEDGGAFCALDCPSPWECETADDCALDPCTLSQCVDGHCVNVSYPDGSVCIAVDPWTGKHHAGMCDGCYCRPSPDY